MHVLVPLGRNAHNSRAAVSQRNVARVRIPNDILPNDFLHSAGPLDLFSDRCWHLYTVLFAVTFRMARLNVNRGVLFAPALGSLAAIFIALRLARAEVAVAALSELIPSLLAHHHSVASVHSPVGSSYLVWVA